MTTAFDITLRAAELCKNVRRGTATGGSATTLVDANHPTRPDDYYNQQPQGTIWFISGNNAGKSAVITDWVDSTHTFTFATPGAACASGNLYAALPGTFTRDAMFAALNAAMADAGRSENSVDITATSGASRYAITCPPELIVRVETIPSGSTTPTEFFWWRAFAGYLYIDAKEPGAGDTIRVYYYDTPTPVTTDAGVVPINIDPAKLAWMTIFYACLPRMQQGENTDDAIKELYGLASNMRDEFMQRRPSRQRLPSPHYANY